MSNALITTDEFRDRLAALLGGSALHGLPRKQLDRQILLKAVVLGLDRSKSYREREVNDALRLQICTLWGPGGTDHVTLRRLLVDAGHLIREADGSTYHVSARGALELGFEPGVEDLDVQLVLDEARAQAARRKREHEHGPTP